MMPNNSNSTDDRATATGPAVWIVMFDRLPVDAACDALDLESTFFEQFMLQNVKSSAGAADLFGGDAAFLKLASAMAESDQSASLLCLMADPQTADSHDVRDELTATLRRCGLPLMATAAVHCDDVEASGSRSGSASDFSSALSASLVWIEASVGMAPDSANRVQRVLDLVDNLLRERAARQAGTPTLIVTCRIGDDHEVHAPLQSRVSEHRMHVPLWIRHGAGHACRVQALAGSFDLLPTVVDFLGHAPPETHVIPSPISTAIDKVESASEDRPLPLSSDPISLVRLCGAPQVCPDRLVKVTGDGGRAARTEHFLLVISDVCQTENDGHDAEASSRRLFVKPEDRFNVCDVAGTYATVADELTSLME